MTEGRRPLEDKKWRTLETQRSAAPETSHSLAERTLSRPDNTEKHFGGAGAAAGHQIMGNSNQPISGNANMSETGADVAVKTSSGSLSKRTLSGAWNTGGDWADVAGRQSMASSNQPFSRNTSMSRSEAKPANLDDSCPSSLRSSSTCTSYSLEISLSTANDEKESQPLPLKTPPESGCGRNKQRSPSVHPGETKLAASLTNSYAPSAPKPLQKSAQPPEPLAAKVRQCTDMLGSCRIETPKTEPNVDETFSSISSGTGKLGAQPGIAGQPPNPASVHNLEWMGSFSNERKVAEELEDTFYAFVILHASEDAEEAERLKTKLERISSTTGASFAEDFAEPGRSTFRCVEDAIHNSAFTMLLLTANFNTHLNEMNTDSALMNSIEKPHKYNTVIPLLPRDNSLTHADLPMMLRTKIPMREKENKAFEMIVRKVLDPEKIKRQKKIWKEEQLVRKQRETQRRLQEENRRRTDLIRESARVRELEKQRMQLLMEQQNLPQPHLYQDFSGGPPGPQQWQGPVPPHFSGAGFPPSSIIIQNAKCIMIGNESTMSVGGGGHNSGDEDCL